ncbi:type II toxin-antitoxin system RelE/ParE family toxin [uncultured Mucilaginibacter sp.]|uniref:type II toxin-antitoxin system RelE family toxin n=1 Tax=uncultured Mucilaginibacter sp. TaxID=797541 RepID=UPI0025DA40EC|nr:type II toxin-antitoxin system RelE/ParE family toxin [uncultured Mucilaginibacter sp.]
MAEYILIIKKSAEKEIANLPLPIVEKLYKEFTNLSRNPRPNGVRKLSGFKNLYRMRLGDYRVVYSIEDNVLIIHVLKVGHRKDVYKF